MLQIKSFTFNPVQENTYIIFHSSGACAIVDPGCYYDSEREALAAFIDQKALKPILLVNTHCHLDHVFGNKFVAETWNLPLHLHPLEQKLLEMAPASGLMYNLPFDNYSGPLNFIKPGEELKIGDEELKILLTPGHSPGSLSFYSATSRFVISGDALFSGSIGRTDLPGGNHEQLIESIKSQLLTLPDETVVYSGHGPETTVGREKKENPFLI
jgi:glyoxylase-like metal-dependent hydrolase (beta-lactamase superfamily II)